MVPTNHIAAAAAVCLTPVIACACACEQVVGSIVGGRRDMIEMLQFASVKGIKPQCETMPLSKVNEAIDRVKANKARYRIVLETDF